MRRARWVLVAFVLSAGTAYADAENPAAHGKSTYGLAGCGLGSMVFGDQKGPIQILAATTNGTFGSQTFGITSGTSNCVEGSGAQGATNFIEGNREALAKDAARGSGETITTLTAMAGCKDAKAVGVTLQKRLDPGPSSRPRGSAIRRPSSKRRCEGSSLPEMARQMVRSSPTPPSNIHSAASPPDSRGWWQPCTSISNGCRLDPAPDSRPSGGGAAPGPRRSCSPPIT